MAFLRITSQDAKGASTTATASATYPATPTAGNLLIASCGSNVGADVLLIDGWNKAAGFGGGTSGGAIFWRISTGNESVVTVTGSNTVTKIHIYEYSGTSNPLFIEKVATSTNGSNTTATGPAITTTYANCLLFAQTDAQGSVTAPSYTAPFNLLQADAATIRLFDADQIVSATGTYSATSSWTTAQIARTLIVAFRDSTTSANNNNASSFFRW